MSRQRMPYRAEVDGFMNNYYLKVFSGQAHLPLARDICRHLGDPLGRMVVNNFPDGETSVRIDEDVRGRDVFIVQPTCPPVNQNLMELLVILDSFKRASPARITVVLPYYGYARQDRKDQGRVPITAKMVADIMTTAGANRVLTLRPACRPNPGVFQHPGRPLACRPGDYRLCPFSRHSSGGVCGSQSG